MTYYLHLQQWGGHFSKKYHHLKMVKHYYGSVRDSKGNKVQFVLGCATRQRVVDVARRWVEEQGNGHKLVVRRKVEKL